MCSWGVLTKVLLSVSGRGASLDKGMDTVPSCVTENPMCRKQAMRHCTVSEKMLSLPSHWLFPEQEVFRYTGRDFTYKVHLNYFLVLRLQPYYVMNICYEVSISHTYTFISVCECNIESRRIGLQEEKFAFVADMLVSLPLTEIRVCRCDKVFAIGLKYCLQR